MKFKAIWTNYKIYAFILGIVAGTIVYNLLGIDFSFSMYEKIQINSMWKSYVYFLIINLKFLVIVFGISFFEIKRKILPIIIFYQAFVLSGLITTMILSGSEICVYAITSVFIKIGAAIFMFNDSKPIINKLISVGVVLVGTLLENFLIFYF